jgi:hypothetical protein
MAKPVHTYYYDIYLEYEESIVIVNRIRLPLEIHRVSPRNYLFLNTFNFRLGCFVMITDDQLDSLASGLGLAMMGLIIVSRYRWQLT